MEQTNKAAKILGRFGVSRARVMQMAANGESGKLATLLANAGLTGTTANSLVENVIKECSGAAAQAEILTDLTASLPDPPSGPVFNNQTLTSSRPVQTFTPPPPEPDAPPEVFDSGDETDTPVIPPTALPQPPKWDEDPAGWMAFAEGLYEKEKNWGTVASIMGCSRQTMNARRKSLEKEEKTIVSEPPEIVAEPPAAEDVPAPPAPEETEEEIVSIPFVALPDPLVEETPPS